jgi:hypothetical protein
MGSTSTDHECDGAKYSSNGSVLSHGDDNHVISAKRNNYMANNTQQMANGVMSNGAISTGNSIIFSIITNLRFVFSLVIIMIC